VPGSSLWGEERRCCFPRVASPVFTVPAHRGAAQMGGIHRITVRGTSGFHAVFWYSRSKFILFDCRFSTFSRFWHLLWPCSADLPWARPMDAA